MAEYRTLKPITVTEGDSLAFYPRPGTIVDIPDDQAAPLLEAGRIESTAPPVQVPESNTPPADPADGEAKTDGAPNPDPNPAPDTASKRRGSRGEGGGSA